MKIFGFDTGQFTIIDVISGGIAFALAFVALRAVEPIMNTIFGLWYADQGNSLLYVFGRLSFFFIIFFVFFFVIGTMYRGRE